MKWGGYPALPGAAEHSREVLLREYFDTMIMKDIVQRFNRDGITVHALPAWRWLL